MKIALISEHASPIAPIGGVDAGGQNVYVDRLARAIAITGSPDHRITGSPDHRITGSPDHRITIFTRRESPSVSDRIRIDHRVFVEHVPAGPARPIPKDELAPYMPEFGAYLARRWETDRPDVAHAHFWMSGLAALAAAKGQRVPVVQTFHALGSVKQRHQGTEDTSPAERIQQERQILQNVDAIIALCSDEVTELLQLNAPSSRIHLIPCGVDVEKFTPHGPAAARDARPRLLTLSRLVRRKGIQTVLEALQDLPGVELLIAGGPPKNQLATDPEANRLRQLTDKYGVADRVRLLGRITRQDVPALLRSADVVVCVPSYEPFGMTALEAMACGVPVVASAVGGFLDTVIDGVTGMHVPPSRPDVLAERLRELITDPQLRARLGTAGAERARTHYSWNQIAAQTLDVYRTLTS